MYAYIKVVAAVACRYVYNFPKADLFQDQGVWQDFLMTYHSLPYIMLG